MQVEELVCALSDIYKAQDKPVHMAYTAASELLSCSVSDLLLDTQCKKQPVDIQNIGYILEALRRNVSFWRILGYRYFWKHKFYLSPFVFEPRPETESLVEWCCQNTSPCKILDVGIGTGCILLSLLHEFPEASGLGIDLSPYAVTQAQVNAKCIGIQADLQCMNLNQVSELFDLVVINPPYVSTKPDETTYFDPPLALFGDESIYLEMFAKLPIAPGGVVVSEIPAQYVSQVPYTSVHDTTNQNIKIIVYRPSL